MFLFKASKRLLPISLGFILLAWTTAVGACPKIFSESGTKSPAKGSGIRSPNKQVLAWSVAVLEKNPEVIRGQLILRNERTARQEIVFNTKIRAGKVLSSPPAFSDANYNIFCIVDWSPDSNYLLLQEILGHLYSDVWNDYYWIYDRLRRQSMVIDLKSLKQAIERYWQKKGLDFRDISYQAVAIGWRGDKFNSVVFEAFTFHHEPLIFLGTWSVAPTGQKPRLLAEKEEEIVVKHFGQVVNRPE